MGIVIAILAFLVVASLAVITADLNRDLNIANKSLRETTRLLLSNLDKVGHLNEELAIAQKESANWQAKWREQSAITASFGSDLAKAKLDRDFQAGRADRARELADNLNAQLNRALTHNEEVRALYHQTMAKAQEMLVVMGELEAKYGKQLQYTVQLEIQRDQLLRRLSDPRFDAEMRYEEKWAKCPDSDFKDGSSWEEIPF